MTALLADIGGTHIRFALSVGVGPPQQIRKYFCADFSGPADAAHAYLADIGASDTPEEGAFAIAAPVEGDLVAMTNHAWSFTRRDLARALGLARLELVNDFTAIALAIPAFDQDDLVKIGAGEAVDGTSIGVLGPGTGLGVSGVVWSDGRSVPLSGEGGHVSLAAATDREEAVIRALREEFDHVSAERVLSGPGLLALYRALCRLGEVSPKLMDPADITAMGLAGGDAECTEALSLFAGFLGSVAGNLALTLGAHAGIYIAGGIVPQLGDWFAGSSFRARFEAKGRYRDYLAKIPTYVITAENPALTGLVRILSRTD